MGNHLPLTVAPLREQLGLLGHIAARTCWDYVTDRVAATAGDRDHMLTLELIRVTPTVRAALTVALLHARPVPLGELEPLSLDAALPVATDRPHPLWILGEILAGISLALLGLPCVACSIPLLGNPRDAKLLAVRPVLAGSRAIDRMRSLASHGGGTVTAGTIRIDPLPLRCLSSGREDLLITGSATGYCGGLLADHAATTVPAALHRLMSLPVRKPRMSPRTPAPATTGTVNTRICWGSMSRGSSNGRPSAALWK